MMEWMVRLQPVSLIIGSLFGFTLMKLRMKKQNIQYENDGCSNEWLSYHCISMEIRTGNFKSGMGHWGANASIISCRKYSAYYSRVRNCEYIYCLEK